MPVLNRLYVMKVVDAEHPGRLFLALLGHGNRTVFLVRDIVIPHRQVDVPVFGVNLFLFRDPPPLQPLRDRVRGVILVRGFFRRAGNDQRRARLIH